MRYVDACTSHTHTTAHSYEVLETLGDSFLKLAVSAHLFMQHPHGQEGLYALFHSLSLSRARVCSLHR